MPKPVDLSTIEGFDWDEANTIHIAKHNVDPKEAEEVFFDPRYKTIDDPKHSKTEERFVVYGKTGTERLLTVVFTVRSRKFRVVSARDMNREERRLYRKET